MSLLLTWHRIKRWLKFWQIGKKAMLVMLLLILGATIYAVIALWPEGEIERKAAGLEQAKEIDSYERVVKSGSLAESIQFIKTFRDDPKEPMTVRMEKLEKKYELAQRIIELGGDEASENVGHQNGLNAKFQLERLYNLNGLSTIETSSQFKALAEALAGSNDHEIARTADLALVYLDAFAIGDEGKSENVVRELHDSMQRFGEKYRNDSYAALQIAEYVGELQQARRVKGTYEALAAFSDAFSGSDNEVIQTAVSQAKRLKRRKKYSLTGSDAANVEKLRQKVLRSNIATANEHIDYLKRNPSPTGKYLELLNCFMLILQAGYSDETESLLRKSRTLFEQDIVPAIRKQRFDEVTKLVDQVGETFTIPDPVASELGERPTLLLLVNSSKLERFPVQLNSIGEMTRMMLSDSNLDVIAVLLQEESEDESWNKFNKLVATFPGIRTLRMSIEDTKSFVADYPISWLPTWVLLDDQKRLSQISPPFPILEEMLLDAIEETSP